MWRKSFSIARAPYVGGIDSNHWLEGFLLQTHLHLTRFCASIAAVECFRRTGGDKLLLCLQDRGIKESVREAFCLLVSEKHSFTFYQDRHLQTNADCLQTTFCWPNISGAGLFVEQMPGLGDQHPSGQPSIHRG